MADEKLPINSELLQRIFKRSSRRLLTLAVEGEAELLEMIHRKAELMQDAEKDNLEVTFTHTIKVNFTKDTQEDRLGGNIKVVLSRKGNLQEDDQEELDFYGGEEVE
jgi:hypothetical protein